MRAYGATGVGTGRGPGLAPFKECVRTTAVAGRQEVAARVGLGFEIPEPSFVPNVPNAPELEAVGVAA